MSRYAKAGITVEELKAKIDAAGGAYEVANMPKIQNDLKKIYFSCENVTDPDEGENFDMPGFQSGYELLPNGVAVCWVGAGGDWEDPLALCVYIGEHNELRAYIPKDGNAYNFKTKSAFGNWDGGDGFGGDPNEDYSEYEEGCECDRHFDEMKHFGIKYRFDMDRLRADASSQITFKNENHFKLY